MVLLAITIGLGGCAGPDPTTGRLYEIEYDHQMSYDCLEYGTRRVDDAFNEANTYLDFVPSDSLSDEYISEADLGLYYFNQVEVDTATGYRKHPGYLCGIRAVLDSIGGEILDTVAGESTLGQGYSFVCVEVADYLWYLDEYIIHELGHQRAALTHLCLNESTMSPAHDDSACVMGSGERAVCTGKDLAWASFCPACRNAISNVTW